MQKCKISLNSDIFKEMINSLEKNITELIENINKGEYDGGNVILKIECIQNNLGKMSPAS